MDDDGYRPDAISTVASADADCSDSTEATSSDPIGDCNDADAPEHPGQTWYKDEDGDWYSDGTMMISCQRPENYYVSSELIRTYGDPDDTDPEIIPGGFPWNMFLPIIINNTQP